MRKTTAGFVAERNHNNNAREDYSYTKTTKTSGFRGKIGRIAAVNLLFLISACTEQASAPALTGQASQEVKPTPTVTVAPTLTAEEIREQKLHEIREVVQEHSNDYTVAEMSAYLAEYGTWEEGELERFMSDYDKYDASFKTFLVKLANEDRNDYGAVINIIPYRRTPETLAQRLRGDPCPDMIDERTVSIQLESLHIDLYDYRGWRALWVKESGKYTTIVYMEEDVDEKGMPYDKLSMSVGGYTFFLMAEDEEYVTYGDDRNIVRIDIKDIIEGNLTDEEIALFSDEVLAAMREGWVEFFIDPETGELTKKRNNFGEMRALLRPPALSSGAAAQETE